MIQKLKNMFRSKALQLIGGIIGVFLLAFFIIPKINIILLGDKKEILESRNLDSGALFYSDSEEAVKGNFLLLKD